MVLLSAVRVLSGQAETPDTVVIPLKFYIGAEITGPAIYGFNKDILTIEGFISADLNERYGIFLGGGYSDFSYSQYNYSYLSSGMFIRAGIDINLLSPKKAAGKYWAGTGLRYGLSFFNSEVPWFESENYWGNTSTSIPPTSCTGHYIEASPGFRAEMFRNFTMGWAVNIRRLIYSSAGRDLKAIYFPGFGQGSGNTSFGISYYFIWNIPYRKIIVITRPENAGDTAGTGVN